MSIKALLSASLLVTMLAGCGQTAGPLAVAKQPGQLRSASAENITQLYGAWFVAKVRKAEAHPQAGMILTLDAQEGEDDMQFGGKLTVHLVVRKEKPFTPRVGDTVAGFVNYPRVDMKRKRFIDQPAKPYFVMDLEKVR